MKIIGIHGYAGTGKDTAADILVAEYEFTKQSFATPLYREVADAFGVSIEFLSDRKTKELPLLELESRRCNDPCFVKLMMDKLDIHGGGLLTPRSPRWLLQQWGTEYRRVHGGHPMYWVDKTGDVYSAIQHVKNCYS